MKLYKVCEYKTGKEIYRGSAQECADFLKMKSPSTFRTYVYHIEHGKSTGSRVGYTAYEIIEKTQDWEALHKANLCILQAFYQEYWRSPRETEFVSCGGNIDVIKHKKLRYTDYVRENGYDNPSKFETYEAINENNEVVFIGTSVDMEDQYEVSNKQLAGYIRKDVKVYENGELIRFRKKPFTGLKGAEYEIKTSVY